MRNWMVAFCSIGLSLAFLWHFICIASYGELIISEPNPLILFCESMLMLAILVFSIVHAILLAQRR